MAPSRLRFGSLSRRLAVSRRRSRGLPCVTAAVPVLWIVLFAVTTVLRARRTNATTTFGSARWMHRRAVRRMTTGSGLLVGRENRRGGRLLRYAGPAHLITIAPTRSGKGVGTIIPNLLTAERSVLAIDPKGENAIVTARARSRFGPVHVLDPFAVTGLPLACCNPLDRIDAFATDAAEDAALLADALVTDPPHQVAEAHWNEEAKALLTGLILFVAAEESVRTPQPRHGARAAHPADRSLRAPARRHAGQPGRRRPGGARRQPPSAPRAIAKPPACSPPRSATRISSTARA